MALFAEGFGAADFGAADLAAEGFDIGEKTAGCDGKFPGRSSHG